MRPELSNNSFTDNVFDNDLIEETITVLKTEKNTAQKNIEKE